MNKNKFNIETKWSLWRITLPNNFGHVYFWVDENNIVRSQREINPLGFMPATKENGSVGENFKKLYFDKEYNLKKIQSHKMTDNELRKGYLIL